MKRNKKVSRKMSVVTTRFTHTIIVLLMAFAMVILNLMASSKCRQLERNCGKKEEVLKKLDDDLQRETAHWEMMKTSEGLEAALRKHGLAMHYPNASQIIRMRANGTPMPGQLSLAKVAQRNKDLRTASYTPSRRTKRRR